MSPALHSPKRGPWRFFILSDHASADHSGPTSPPIAPAPSFSGLRSNETRGLRRFRPDRIGVGFIALFGSLLVLGALAENVREQEASALDAFATPFLHSLASPTLDAAMRLATALGSTIVVGPLFLVVLALLLWRRYRSQATFLAVALAGSVALDEALKSIFHRPRPQLAWATVQPDYSFPSGHAMNSLVFYVALALVVWTIRGRPLGPLAVVLATVLTLLIGTSRIYLGYHYFTDVAAGFAAGAAWLLTVGAGFQGGIGHRPRPGRARGP